MTEIQAALIRAALAWYQTNLHDHDLLRSNDLVIYYARPEVRALVEACADLYVGGLDA